MQWYHILVYRHVGQQYVKFYDMQNIRSEGLDTEDGKVNDRELCTKLFAVYKNK